MISSVKISTFQEKILTWFACHKRSFPWRETCDPYAIVVSEVMLQQTQASRVVFYYNRFLKRFPDVFALAKAQKRELLSLWSGLGYNNRALRLQLLAKTLVQTYTGRFPLTYDELVALPGIGPYTAGAVLAFAFNKEVAVIDTNVRRVLVHEFDLDEKICDAQLNKLALLLVPKGKARLWYNALMDYGSLVLTAKRTGITPISKQSTFSGSDREVRGFVLKELTKGRNVTFAQLKKSFPLKDVHKIVHKMVKEDLVSVKGSSITLD